MESGFNEAPLGQKTKKKITFFNLGKKNNWKKLIPKEMLDKINHVFKEDLSIDFITSAVLTGRVLFSTTIVCPFENLAT